MVDAVRKGSTFLLFNLIGTNDIKSQEPIAIVLGHKAMTASAQWDVFGALVALKFQNKTYSEKNIGKAKQILREMRKEYQELFELRNRLLHSTWRIGWGNEYMSEQEFQEINVFRTEVSSKGVNLDSPLLENNVSDLRELIVRCEENAKLILRFQIVLIDGRDFNKNLN